MSVAIHSTSYSISARQKLAAKISSFSSMNTHAMLCFGLVGQVRYGQGPRAAAEITLYKCKSVVQLAVRHTFAYFIFSTLLQQHCCNSQQLRYFPTSAERRSSDHTWSVTTRSCPSSTEGAALVASCSSHPIQAGTVFIADKTVCLSTLKWFVYHARAMQVLGFTFTKCEYM